MLIRKFADGLNFNLDDSTINKQKKVRELQAKAQQIHADLPKELLDKHPSQWPTDPSDPLSKYRTKKYIDKWIEMQRYHDTANDVLFNYASKNPAGPTEIAGRYNEIKHDLRKAYEEAREIAAKDPKADLNELITKKMGPRFASYSIVDSVSPTSVQQIDYTLSPNKIDKLIDREAKSKAIGGHTAAELNRFASMPVGQGSSPAMQGVRLRTPKIGVNPFDQDVTKVSLGRAKDGINWFTEVNRKYHKAINEVVVPHLTKNAPAYIGGGAALLVGGALVKGVADEAARRKAAEALNTPVYALPGKLSNEKHKMSEYQFEQLGADSVHVDKPLKNFSVKISQNKKPMAAAPAINMHPDLKDDRDVNRGESQLVKKLNEYNRKFSAQEPYSFIRAVVNDFKHTPIRTGSALTAATVTPVIAYKALKENQEFHRESRRYQQKNLAIDAASKHIASKRPKNEVTGVQHSIISKKLSEWVFEDVKDSDKKTDWKRRREREAQIIHGVEAGIAIADVVKAIDSVKNSGKRIEESDQKERERRIMSLIASELKNRGQSVSVTGGVPGMG